MKNWTKIFKLREQVYQKMHYSETLNFLAEYCDAMGFSVVSSPSMSEDESFLKVDVEDSNVGYEIIAETGEYQIIILYKAKNETDDGYICKHFSGLSGVPELDAMMLWDNMMILFKKVYHLKK